MKLNKQQEAAAHYNGNNDHVLVLAGAGTGKTRTIIGRAIYLLKNNVSAKSIVLLTFTRRAAAEMTHRLKLETGTLAEGIFAGTFHRFSLDVMKRAPKTFGIDSFVIIDRDDQLSLIKLIRGSVLTSGFNKNFPKAGKVLDLYSYAKNTCRPPEQYLLKHTDLSPEVITLILSIFKKYEDRKTQRHYIDFDDILNIFLSVIKANAKLREKLKSLFSNILVDEMQDTNPLQWAILEQLANPASLFCVGDDAQSIYAFRGADFQNVHSFTKRMANSEVIKLAQNYRSHQEPLDLANWLLKGSDLDYGKELSSVKGSGSLPQLIDFDNPFKEAEWYGDMIIKRRQEGTMYRDFMILVRTAYIARHIESVFVEKEIPYQFIGGTALLKSAHVRDLLSLLRSAMSHRDEIAWIRYLKLWPKIGDITASRTIDQLIDLNDSKQALMCLKDRFVHQPSVYETVEAVAKELSNPQKAIKTAVLTLSPLLKEKYDHWDSRLKDLDLLVRISARYSSLPEFLETFTLDPVYNKDPDATAVDDAVTIITIHSAKGAEAPICMIPQAVPGNYPFSRSIGNKDEVEEERRILYVALTRVKEELFITRSSDVNHRVFFGGSGMPQPEVQKYFFHDLPDNLVESIHESNSRGDSFLTGLDGFD